MIRAGRTPLLGTMPVLANAFAYVAGYNMSLMLILQSKAQLRDRDQPRRRPVQRRGGAARACTAGRWLPRSELKWLCWRPHSLRMGPL
ncbi:type IV secretory system conjugative DNA transfer family protein [Azospirillum sp. CT11-132]|uniref:type IV secretory system conjugative DNA transfer family protein n=1 Tax=Azospirillum sp. CT11-132 TaxID=3396317 RepID=UPI0039A660F3